MTDLEDSQEKLKIPEDEVCEVCSKVSPDSICSGEGCDSYLHKACSVANNRIVCSLECTKW